VLPYGPSSLAFSPDGTRVAFITAGSTSAGTEGIAGHLNIISSDGRCNIEPITNPFVPFLASQLGSQVSWAADGNHVHFTAGPDVYSLDLGTPGAAPTLLTPGGAPNPTPASTPTAHGVLQVQPGDDGYLMSASNGQAFNFGASCLSVGAWSGQTVVGAAAEPGSSGLWQASALGAVRADGSAPNLGDASKLHLSAPVVGIQATEDGGGYWLVASDGGIFNYGDASFYGSAGSLHLNKPVVGMAPTPDGKGYWLVASDGGIFTYGDASFYGSAGSIRLVQPIVGMQPTAQGYRLVATDGGVFTYGDARFYGSAAAVSHSPIVSLVQAVR